MNIEQSHFSLGVICLFGWRDLTLVGSGDLTMKRSDRIPLFAILETGNKHGMSCLYVNEFSRMTTIYFLWCWIAEMDSYAIHT